MVAGLKQGCRVLNVLSAGCAGWRRRCGCVVTLAFIRVTLALMASLLSICL